METSHRALRSNIWKFYIHEALAGMFFSVPVIVIFWQSNGLSLTQVMVLQSLFSLIIVALDVPTGYLADVFGRKRSILVADIFLVLGIAVYSVGHDFWVFLIAETLFGLSASLSSGACSALVYDSLLAIGDSDQYKQLWGNILFFQMIALAVSGIFGGLLAGHDVRWALYASIPFFACMIPVALSLYEPPAMDQSPHRKGHVHALFGILHFAANHPTLRWLIIYAGAIYALNSSILWLYQPYFAKTGVSIVYYGAIFACFQIVAAFSSRYAHKIEAFLGMKTTISLIPFLIGIGYILMGNIIFIASFVFCFIGQFVRGIYTPILEDVVHGFTTSDMRATILSLQSTTGRLLYALVIPVVGWMADAYTITQAITALGITTLIIGVWIASILYRKL